MAQPHVLVILGGTSDERAVSLRSGAAVAAGLEAAGYRVSQLDYQGILPDISEFDVAFPILHGAGGEDGQIQLQLDAANIPYVGSGVAASKLCFDKFVYKQLLIDRGLPVSGGELVTETQFVETALRLSPYVLKPFDGGSSVDTIVVRETLNADQSAISAAFGRHEKMLIEPLSVGVEITVGILGDEALPVIEIIPPVSGEFDYENKYNGQSQELCPPRSVSAAGQAAAQKLAHDIHKVCGCEDYSRTDMIVTESGALVVLETNTIPGMTDQSLFPKAAATAGMDFDALTDSLVKLAMNR